VCWVGGFFGVWDGFFGFLFFMGNVEIVGIMGFYRFDFLKDKKN